MFHLLDLLLLALFLFPIAVYFTVLGMMNRRPQPLMVSGAWDFTGVLLATSGLLLFGVPALLSGAFGQNLRELPMEHDSGALGSAIAEVWTGWLMAWVLYYLLLLGGAAVLVWMRRGTTVIYNVGPQTLDTVLSRTANRLGLEIYRHGNRLHFRPGAVMGISEMADDGKATSPSVVHMAPSSALSAVVELEPFPMFSNVLLHWRSATKEARADLERELRTDLSQVLTFDNPAGGWLLSIAGFLFLLIIVLTTVFVIAVMAIRMGRP